MRCPYCNYEMDKGLIQKNGEIFWLTIVQKRIIRSCYTKEDIAREFNVSIADNNSPQVIEHCETCQHAIFQNLQDDTDDFSDDDLFYNYLEKLKKQELNSISNPNNDD